MFYFNHAHLTLSYLVVNNYDMFWNTGIFILLYKCIMHNAFGDKNRWAIPLGVMVSLFILYWRCYGRRKHGSLLPLYRSNKNGPNRPRTD